MENPAHVYTTGIPMSEKGNFAHNKYGCDDGETLNLEHISKSNEHNYTSGSDIILRHSISENNEFLHNSIQDGFQSEILCSFVCDAGLPESDDHLGDHTALEMDSIAESTAHIEFANSPEPPFSEKIDAFSSMEVLVSSFDEQLDSYLLSDFKSMSKATNDTASLEEQQRTVTETISAIAKSFGLEDLLPDTFQVSSDKDDMSSVSVAPDSLCDVSTENIAGLSLGDFGKCESMPSPEPSLSLPEEFDSDGSSYCLNGLEMLNSSESHHRSFETIENPDFPILLKEEDAKRFLNTTDVADSLVNHSNGGTSFVSDEIECSSSEECSSPKDKQQEVNSNFPVQDEIVNIVNEDLINDIPTVSISDIQVNNSSEAGQNTSSGTVLITRDKSSKKMQIVLTLDQGQQIYDIDTEDVECNEQPLDLDFSGTFECLSDDNVQEDIPKSPDAMQFPEEQIYLTEELESEKSNEAKDQEAALPVTNLVEFEFFPPHSRPPKFRKGKSWVCPVENCGQVLDKECKLRVHMINHKNARPFKCSIDGCDWAFTTPYRLRRHIDTHLGSKDYVCDFEGCNRKFTTVYNLKTHKKRHKWPNALTCPSKDCKLSFANRRKLELHLRVHTDVEAPYKCSMCGKQYYSANCIASHYRTHQYNEDDFKCPFQGCGKVYDKICRLRQHIRHHTGERPYTCPAEGCKWSFMSASKLTRHMRKHTGERKFVCTEPGCGKSFMRPEHLKGHIVIHSGDKPFHCPHENCNARFTAKSSLYVHVKKHCPSVLKVVYPCPVTPCLKKYNSKATLKQHLQKLHPETLQNGKALNIAEKLELTMPVSVVNPENSMGLLELEENATDDPSPDLKVQLLQSSEPPNSTSASTSSPVIINAAFSCLDLSFKNVPKSSKARIAKASESLGSENLRTSDRSVTLIQKNSGGCARTDFYCEYVRKFEPEPDICLTENTSDNHDTKNYLSHSQLSSFVKTPDIMLASNLLFSDHTSEHGLKSHFSHDESSTGHSLYQDDSILAGSSAFGTDLMSGSLLSDEEGSDEVIFEQTGMHAFHDSIHLHDLE